MSIYATIGGIYVEKPDYDWISSDKIVDNLLQIDFQAVPGHIKHEWDFLPPNVDDDDKIRAVFFCAPWTKKEGQQYINPLFMLTGDEWYTMPFREVYNRIIDETESQFPLYYHMVPK